MGEQLTTLSTRFCHLLPLVRMREDLDLPNPVIRSHYGHGFIKQYVRDHVLLRTESATNNVNDYAVNKAHPRQLALMHALLRFSHIAAESTFTTAELHPQTAEALDCSTTDYRLSALRYDLSKLRAKGLVDKIPHSRRYRLLPNGYRICLVF